MSAENFQDCLAFTLKYEGGQSNDAHDPGGRTMEGVTQATYDAYRSSKGQKRWDVYLMNPAERDEIYRRDYWDKVTGDSLPHGVNLCIFDLAVNSGPARALRVYATIAHGLKPAEAIDALCTARLSFLHGLGTWSYFGTGWGKRVAACEALALQMAGGSLETARDKMNAKKRGANTGSAIVFGGGLAVILQSLGLHWGWTLGGTIALALIILWFIGKGRIAAGRADMLGAAIAEMKAKHDLLEQTTKRVAAQTFADSAIVLKKQQEITTAEAAMTAFGIKQEKL